MPRLKRKREETVSPVLEELLATEDVLDRARLGESGMTPKKLASEKAAAAAKWQRREAKAIAKWRRMTFAEQKAWAEAYLRDERRLDAEARMPKAADLPLLFATLTVAERVTRKHLKATAKRVAVAESTRGDAVATNARRPSATRPSPALEEPPTHDEPPKAPRRRKRRSGPAFGPIGQQIDGVFYPYDEDDDE
ncbi:hypothetical protein [Microbacterium maritypicum]|uniref:hypothetical protein n=1 Tax=Microbacterium maritypicum TaxID=33918 RepID=UPI00296E2D4E|nr:hypothetical protein [Microbacterium liquefaciens]